jgi:hypothetical protein
MSSLYEEAGEKPRGMGMGRAPQPYLTKGKTANDLRIHHSFLISFPPSLSATSLAAPSFARRV